MVVEPSYQGEPLRHRSGQQNLLPHLLNRPASASLIQQLKTVAEVAKPNEISAAAMLDHPRQLWLVTETHSTKAKASFSGRKQAQGGSSLHAKKNRHLLRMEKSTAAPKAMEREGSRQNRQMFLQGWERSDYLYYLALWRRCAEVESELGGGRKKQGLETGLGSFRRN